MEVGGKLEADTSYKDRDWRFSIYDLFAGFLCHQASSYIDRTSRDTDYTAKTLKLSPTGNYSSKELH